MRVLMLADRSFALREQAMLSRVEVGLMDDGARVLRAVPEGLTDLEPGTLTPTIRYEDAGPAYAARARAGRLLRAVRDIEPPLAGASPDDLLDVVHVWGEGAWNGAIDVASAAGAGLAIELWSGRALRRIRQAERRAATRPAPASGVWLAPNDAIRAAAEALRPAWPVRVAPWGVHTDRVPTRAADPDRAVGVCVVGSGADARATEALLEAFAALGERDRPALMFLDAAIVERRRSVWKRAGALGLLERVSVVADPEARRELALGSDVLVLPDAAGEVRSITLDAMAAGVVVLARPDPYVEVTAEPDIALLVDPPTRAGWADALAAIVEDPSRLAGVGETARRRVTRMRPVHRQIGAILEAYRTLTSRPSLAFPAR